MKASYQLKLFIIDFKRDERQAKSDLVETRTKVKRLESSIKLQESKFKKYAKIKAKTDRDLTAIA